MAISRLDEFLATIPDDDNRERMVEMLDWVAQHYPELELRTAWNQPMFTHHGNVHHQVLGRIQAHGYGTRARHHDPLRAGHA
jgi:uncharacterized protein ydhG